jgi:hypothetical protein
MSQSNHYPIVGAHFRPPAKIILQFLPMNAPLVCEREPSNEFDSNAIAVFVQPSAIPESVREELGQQSAGFGYSLDDIMAAPRWHLGYVPAKFTAELAAAMDNQPRSDLSTPPQALGKLCCDSKGKPAVMLDDPAFGRQQFFPVQGE